MCENDPNNAYRATAWETFISKPHEAGQRNVAIWQEAMRRLARRLPEVGD